MRAISGLISLLFVFALAGCLETVPKLPAIGDLPASPTLKDRNARSHKLGTRPVLTVEPSISPEAHFVSS